MVFSHRRLSGLNYLEDFVELIVHVSNARKGRGPGDHFDEDAPHAPEVQGRGVVRAPQQHVRRPVPERHHLVAVRARRHRLGASQAW